MEIDDKEVEVLLKTKKKMIPYDFERTFDG